VEAGLLARLWSRLAHLWGEAGSILDPDGLKTQAGAPGGGAAPTGDEGSRGCEKIGSLPHGPS